MECGGPDPGDPGTHVHVVDAVAAYRPPVVAEVVLDSGVPHLKFRRGGEKGTSQHQVGSSHGEPSTRSTDTPRLLSATGVQATSGYKQALRASLFRNMPCFQGEVDLLSVRSRHSMSLLALTGFECSHENHRLQSLDHSECTFSPPSTSP